MNGDDPAIPRPNAATDVGAGATTTGHRIEGVRRCLQCGHDLNGQPILKEPDLGLLLARCPECGRAAALDEGRSGGLAARCGARAGIGHWLRSEGAALSEHDLLQRKAPKAQIVRRISP